MAQKKANTQIENQVDEVFEKAENISDKVMDEASAEETVSDEPQPETEQKTEETVSDEPQPETEQKTEDPIKTTEDPLYDKIASLLEENGRYAHIECGKYLTDGINPKSIHNFYMEFKDWGETSTSKDLELLDLLRQYCERE